MLRCGPQVLQTRNDGEVAIHPSSLNFNCPHFQHPFLLYHEKVCCNTPACRPPQVATMMLSPRSVSN